MKHFGFFLYQLQKVKHLGGFPDLSVALQTRLSFSFKNCLPLFHWTGRIGLTTWKEENDPECRWRHFSQTLSDISNYLAVSGHGGFWVRKERGWGVWVYIHISAEMKTLLDFILLSKTTTFLIDQLTLEHFLFHQNVPLTVHILIGLFIQK